MANNPVYDPEDESGGEPTYRKPPDLGSGPSSADDLQRGESAAAKPPGDDQTFPGNKDKGDSHASEESGGLFNKHGEGAAGLDDQEKAAATGAANRSLDPAAQGWRGKATRFFFGSKARKKKSAAGGLTVVAVGGVLVGGSLLSGPLEFVHLAQLLEQFHFSNQQDESDDRVSKLIRYAHYAPKDEAYKTNLNYVGNKLADKFETKLNEQGLESAYTKRFGLKQGYIIDEENENFKNKTAEEIQSELREKYNNSKLEVTTITDDEGNERLLMKQPSGYRASLGVTRETLKEAGYGKVASAIGARIMGERDGVSWHPLRKLDNKIYSKLEDKIKEWNKEKAENISDGEPTNPSGAADPDEQPGETDAEKAAAAANAGDAASQGNEVAQQGDSVAKDADSGGDPDNSKLSGFTDSVSAKIGLGGVAAAGVLCMARGIAENVGNVKQAQTALPLIRTGMRAVSEGNQVMKGQDVDIDQLSNDSKQFTDQSGQSWYNAQSIQAEMGNPDQGVAPDDTLKDLSSGSPLDFLLGGNPLADALNPICSTAGQVIQNVVGFLGGPVSFIGGAVISQFVGPPVVHTISQYMAGQAAKLNPAGPEFGNYANFGVFLAANDQALSGGGRTLSDGESQQLADITNADTEQQFDQHNLAYRLFNPDDRMSLVSSIMDKEGGSAKVAATNMSFATLNIGHSLATTFGSIFSGVSHAASPPYNYGGMSEMAFSPAEMDNPDTENPYENGDAVADILNSSAGGNYISQAKECFGDTLDQVSVQNPDGSSAQVWDVQFGSDPVNIYSASYKAIQGTCNSTSDPNWLKIRFFIFDTQNLDALNCYNGDDDSCSKVGFGDTSGSGGSSGSGTVTTGISGNGSGSFTTDTSATPYPGLDQMLARVKTAAQPDASAANTAAFCASIGGCSGRCESAVEMAWLGHTLQYNDPYGNPDPNGPPGPDSAWAAGLAAGVAHPGGRNPPVGALLIYTIPGDQFGHITIYLGNNLVFSTDFDYQGQVGIQPASHIETANWANSYVGWMDPLFSGKIGDVGQ